MAHLTFLGLVLVVTVPPVLAEWLVGHVMLRRALRPLALAVTMATIYLGLADVAAFNNGIFEVADDRSLPLDLGDFVVEDWILLLLSNLAIAQAAVLLLGGRFDWAWWRRLRGP